MGHLTKRFVSARENDINRPEQTTAIFMGGHLFDAVLRFNNDFYLTQIIRRSFETETLRFVNLMHVELERLAKMIDKNRVFFLFH